MSPRLTLSIADLRRARACGLPARIAALLGRGREGLACIAGPAPFCNVLPLPLAIAGAALAVPPLLGCWE